MFDFVTKEGRLQEHLQPHIFSFDPLVGWQRASEPFATHRNVDVTKAVGIGPGIPFACHYLLDPARPPRSAVFLVPTAAGGTYLDEWSPSYVPTADNR